MTAGAPSRSAGRSPWWAGPLPVIAVGGSVVVVWWLAVGHNFVLDDWWSLRNATFDGVWAAGGADQARARPGAWLTYGLLFGVIGAHPAVIGVIQASLVVVAAVVLRRLLSRFTPASVATAAAVVWLVLPNHTSLERWASTTNATVALLLLVIGLDVTAARPLDGRRAALAGTLLAVGGLFYEAIVPAAMVGAVALPWLASGRFQKSSLATAAGPALAAGWVVAMWHPAKEVSSGWADLSPAFGAHLAWGIAPAGTAAALVGAVGAIGVVVVLWRAVTTRCWAGPHGLVAAGLVVAAVGVAPFVRWSYEPFGAGDRMTVVSGIGGAMVWAGVGWGLWNLRREVAVAAAVGLAGVALVARAELVETWDRAGDDAVRIATVIAQADELADPLVVGPYPVIRSNMAAYQLVDHIEPAAQLALGDRSQRVRFAEAGESWDLDLTQVSRLDD